MTDSPVIEKSESTPETEGTGPAGGVVYPVTGSVSLQITPEKTGCTATVLQKDEPVYTRMCKTDPWESKQIQGEIINASFPKLDPDRHPDKERYRTAFLNLFARIKRDVAANPLMKRMLSDTLIEDLIAGTDSVIAYPGENTTFEITLRGKKLIFTAKEFAHKNATALNEKYINIFMKALDATSTQWQEIRNHWLDCTVVEQENPETGIDILIERLAGDLCRDIRIYDNADLVDRPDKGYYDDESKAYWVPSVWITAFLEKYGAETQKDTLSKELKKRGHTIGASKRLRLKNIPGGRRYCWQFSGDFVHFPVGEGILPRTLVSRLEDPSEVSHVSRV